MIVCPEELATDGWVYQIRTRMLPRWQSGYGHEIEQWCEKEIGARDQAWTISFGRFMFRSRSHAMLFQLTWG